MRTEEIVQKIQIEHPDSVLNRYTSYGQTTVEVNKVRLIACLQLLKENGFDVLMDLTAADYLHPEIHTKVFYFLHNTQNFDRLRIFVSIAREESLPSVTGIWAGASWYERELFDLFGVHFNGHSDLKRLLMPDDWLGHPLRKDYALTEEPVQFKHGVKPKIPSEIIPHVKKNARF